MVIDSSALIAILEGEPESRLFRDLIIRDEMRLVSAATMVETSIVALGRRGEAGLERLQAFIETADIDSVAFRTDQIQLALDAFRRYGKGRHRAALNFGDCFSYALAKATGEPLLFKGDDFGHTDISPAAQR
jgi:ribonuclease VapC